MQAVEATPKFEYFPDFPIASEHFKKPGSPLQRAIHLLSDKPFEKEWRALPDRKEIEKLVVDVREQWREFYLTNPLIAQAQAHANDQVWVYTICRLLELLQLHRSRSWSAEDEKSEVPYPAPSSQPSAKHALTTPPFIARAPSPGLQM